MSQRLSDEPSHRVPGDIDRTYPQPIQDTDHVVGGIFDLVADIATR